MARHSTRLKDQINKPVIRKEYTDLLTKSICDGIRGIDVIPPNITKFTFVSPVISRVFLKDNDIMHGLAYSYTLRKKIKVEYIPMRTPKIVSINKIVNGVITKVQKEIIVIDYHNGYWREI